MADTEKITINMNPVELGKIDVLVDQGHYSNRTDFIRTSIRLQLEKHTSDVQQAVAARSLVVGVISYDRAQLERCRAKRKKLAIRVLGLLHLSDDISPEMANAAIESIWVRGMFKASDKLKAALAGKIH